MSISFSTIELINIAIGIERMGIAFYDVMTKSTENQELASQELEHKQKAEFLYTEVAFPQTDGG
ncbi:unnamed protein product [marine sediment metagenome]|uniref:Rubrerythrin diiron-binding domain-containing protein n=1 Tax=marine sediment metagenome TaxID=412755 RepID=X0X461_9ZZZZ